MGNFETGQVVSGVVPDQQNGVLQLVFINKEMRWEVNGLEKSKCGPVWSIWREREERERDRLMEVHGERVRERTVTRWTD